MVSALQEAGFNVFWDRRIPPGREPMDFLGTKLGECRCVVVVWTRSSISSQFVRSEALHGYDRHQLVPVRLEDVVPSFPFANIQAADLSNWEGDASSDAVLELVAEIARFVTIEN